MVRCACLLNSSQLTEAPPSFSQLLTLALTAMDHVAPAASFGVAASFFAARSHMRAESYESRMNAMRTCQFELMGFRAGCGRMWLC